MSDWYEDDRIFRVRESPVRYVDPRRRSRDRFRPPVSHSPPSVVINNSVFNDYSDEEEERLRTVVMPPARRRSLVRPTSVLLHREDVELDATMKELRDLKLEISSRKTKAEQEATEKKKLQVELETKRFETMKRELEEIKKKETTKKEEERLKKELELNRLQEAERRAKANEERDMVVKAALETYKANEIRRIAKEEQDQKTANEALKRRMQQQLAEAGLPDAQIDAIMNPKKATELAVARVVAPPLAPHPAPPQIVVGRPTYTRMARRYVSFETLKVYALDYDLDPENPEYLLIKRWVPEAEQYSLWNHTRLLREKRDKVLMIDRRPSRHHHDNDFEWVRQRPRKRSKSPGLLLFLAGANHR